MTGFRCPVCEAPTLVKETRGDLRRRECFNGHRFTTMEVIKVKRSAVHRISEEGRVSTDVQVVEQGAE